MKNTFDESTEHKKSNSRVSGIKSILFIILFVGCVLGMMIFSNSNPVIAVGCVGVLVSGIVIIQVFSGGFSLKKAPALFVVAFGWGAVLLPMYMASIETLDDYDHAKLLGIVIVSAVLLFFFLFRLWAIICGVRERLRGLSHCTYEVTAVCADLEKSKTHSYRNDERHKQESFRSTWKFVYNGNEYTVKEREFTNNHVPQVGGEYPLLIDPDASEEIFRPQGGVWSAKILIGSLFVIASTATAITLIVLAVG